MSQNLNVKCLLKNTVFYSDPKNYLNILFILEEADVNWMFSGGYSDHCYNTSGRVRLGQSSTNTKPNPSHKLDHVSASPGYQ